MDDVNNTDGEALNAIQEAEQCHLQATFILNELQANVSIYGSNSLLSGATPADIPLAIKYIDRSINLFPNSAIYLNTKALLLNESGTDPAEAMKLMERAHELSPNDIAIEDNLQKMKSNSCFIATAALGSPSDPTVVFFRKWRDQSLTKTKVGRELVDLYYKVSPDMAIWLAKRSWAKRGVRFSLLLLEKIISLVFRKVS